MNLAVVSLNLLEPLYVGFGWFMRVLYDFIGNYGAMIIVFTIILRGALIPIGIKQQKSTLKQQALQGEIAEIQRAYPNDKTKQNQLQMELYKKHGASPLSGCLPSILQLIIIWPIFYIFRQPLQYIMGLTADQIKNIGTLLSQLNLIDANQLKGAVTNNIPIINALSTHAGALAQAVNGEMLRLNQLLDLNFLGMNLGLVPAWQPDKLFGAELRTYLPLLIFPLLTLVTTVAQMRIMRMTMPNRKKKAEDKEREKMNPARAGQTPEDKSESMMKTMNLIMPVFMLWTTFTMPAAMGLYWVIGNIMMILQSVIIYFLFTKKLQQPDKQAAPAPAPENKPAKA
jgi:YidC/Oxa1 family membrane protein insertase